MGKIYNPPALPSSVESSRRQLKEFAGTTGGGSDESAAWNSMMNKVSEAGGGFITVPAGTYRLCGVYWKPGVYLDFLPGAIFKYALTAAGEAANATIFNFSTESSSDTTFLENVGWIGEFYVDGSDLGSAPRYEVAGNPSGITVTNCKHFSFGDARGKNLPGPAGNVINMHANGGGAEVGPTHGVIGDITHEGSIWVGNSAIQYGSGCIDIDIGHCRIYGQGVANRVESHVSSASTEGKGNGVQVKAATAELPTRGAWRALTAVAATGVFTTTGSHLLEVGDVIRLREIASEGGGASGLTVDTNYFIVEVPSATTFKVATTYGGSVKTFSKNLSSGYVGMHGAAVYLLAHDETSIRRMVTMMARATNGADGVYASHDASALVRDCAVYNVTVTGGGRLTRVADGGQYDFTGTVIGPGRVNGSAGVGCVRLPNSTYNDCWAFECGNSGFRDAIQTDGSTNYAVIKGGGAIANTGLGTVQNSYARHEYHGFKASGSPQTYGIEVASGKTAYFFGGDLSGNATGESTGAGTLEVEKARAELAETAKVVSAENALVLPGAIPTYKNTGESATENKPMIAVDVARLVINSTVVLSSGVPEFAALPVQARTVISGVSMFVNTTEGTAANRTHLWVALLNSKREIVARSADYASATNTPMGSLTARALKFTEPYTVGASNTVVYAVVCEVMSSTAAITLEAKEGRLYLNELTPVVGGSCGAGQTTPEAFTGTPTLTALAKAPVLGLI